MLALATARVTPSTQPTIAAETFSATRRKPLSWGFQGRGFTPPVRIASLAAACCVGLCAFALTPANAQQTAAAKAPVDRYTLIRCGHLLAVPGKPTQDNATIIVHNGLIDRITDGLTGPDLTAAKQAGATVDEIDLKSSYVLPGLIDCHVHVTFEFTADARLRAVTESDATSALHGVAFARKTLDAGFTTVRDLGSTNSVSISLRDSIERGEVAGPRIVAAGQAITVTGGHADGSNGYRPDLFGVPGAEKGVADGPDECRKAVRYQIKLGADCIKLTATGGVLSASTAGLRQHFFDDELKAIIDTAHAMGRKAAAHAHGLDGINAALRAGVDSIEHGTYLDDTSITLFKEHKAFLVPTLLAGFTVAKNAETPGYYLPMVANKAKIVGPKMLDMFKRAHEGGVKIAFGTDTGVSPHGENAQEFALMVKGGMTPTEAITAATITAADLCGLSAQIGTLESGKSADLIAVTADPTKDVTELERVRFVMKSGTVYKAAR